MSYHAGTTKKPLNSSIQVLLKKGAHIGLGLGAFTPMLALANPTGGNVVAGTATIKNPNVNTTVVKESSQSAIIDWQQFNIGKGQFVQFLQPSSSSVILNRVIGGGGTSIFGSLTGNGQIFLVNTNGVYFGKGASIDAQGFLASTLDIADSDFLAGHYTFDKGSNADAQIVNQGNITAHKGGYVVLAGDYAENDGLITAQSGHIVLASGSKSTLTLNGNSLVSYAINQATLANLAGASNAGKLQADGGTVLMTADVANLLKATVVNNTGLIEAHAISKSGGVIQLLATGGNIENAGTIDASATRAGIAGGSITLKGDERTTLTDASRIIATGDGANGGHVEVSGDTLTTRGAMTLGKGGDLLLDPNEVKLVTGNGNGGHNLGTGTGANASIGTGFIITQLNAGANVSISAHALIDASTNVHTLHATGKGDLVLRVSHTGSITLGNVDIAIGGGISAGISSSTHGTGQIMSFGHLTAAAVAIGARGDKVSLAPSAVVSGKTVASITATTSNLIIHAGSVQARSSGSLNLNAKANLKISGSIENLGQVTLKAGASLDAKHVHAIEDVNITGVRILPGTFITGGDITIKGSIGSITSSAVTFSGPLQIQAGGAVRVDHSIRHLKSISILGSRLIYTGTGKTFSLSAADGDLQLLAQVGSAAAPVKYNVTLMDHGAHLLVGRSIYTGNTTGKAKLAANITATEIDTAAGNSFRGVIVGSNGSQALTLSAKGAITLTGEAVGIGTAVGGPTTSYAAIALKAGKNISLTATGHGSGSRIGDVVIKAGTATDNGGADNRGILVQAGGNLSLTGKTVDVSGGHATAFLAASASAASATLVESVTMKAGGNITLTATNNANLHAGNALATVSANAGSLSNGETHKATVDASVNLTAGKALSVSAQQIDVSGGYGVGKASGNGGNGVADATANASVNLKAGTTLTLNATANTLRVHGGGGAGSEGFAHAVHPGAKADVSVVSDVNLTAAAISLTGNVVDVSAGGDVGFQSSSLNQAVKATTGGSAQQTLSADVNLNAGLGGIAITAVTGNVAIEGGSHLVKHTFVDGQNGTAALDAQARVNLKTTGNVTLKAHSAADISAGISVASVARASAGEAGVATMKADAGVGITAANLTVTADTAAIEGGRSPGWSDNAHAFGSANAPGRADMQSLARVDITAKGGITVTTGHGLQILAAKHVGAQSSATASLHYNAQASESGAAKAAVSADGGIALTAGGNISLTAGTAEGANLNIDAGSLAGQYAAINATGGGAASFHALSRVDISAKGAFTAKTTGALLITGGSGAMQTAVASAGGAGKAKSAADAGLSLKAAAVTLQGGSSATISAGGGAGLRASVDAAGGSANLSAKADVSVTATGMLTVVSTHNDVNLKAGGGAAFGARAGLNGSDTGKAMLSATGNLSLQGGTISVTASSGHVTVDGGYGVAGHAKAHAGAGGQQSVSGQGNVSLAATAGSITLKGKKGVGALGGFSAAAGGHSFHSNSSFISSGGIGSTHFVKKRQFNFNQTDFTEAQALGAGAKATVTGTATVNLSATGGISLIMTGASGSGAVLEAGYGAATLTHASASNGGVAAVHGANGVMVKAGGAVTLSGKEAILGGGAIAMHGAPSSESSRVIQKCITGHGCTNQNTFTKFTPPPVDQAKGAGAQVSVSADDSINIKAGSATFTALNSNVLLNVGGAAGQHLHGVASSGGHLSFQHIGGIDIVATGAVAATAFNSFLIHGAAHSSAALLTADGKGAVVHFDTGATVDITAATVSVAARSGIDIDAGLSAGKGAVLTATHGGIAEEAVSDGVEITAKTSFKATLTGSGSGGGIAIDGGFFGGESAHLTASNAGLATLTAQADLGIQVTAATGTLVISAGKHANGELSISGGGYLAKFAHVKADHGSASLAASGGITFAAKGAVTLGAAAAGAHMTINAREDIGSGAHGSASSHGQATLRGMSNISVSGGNVTVNTGGALKLFGGKNGNGAGAVVDALTGGVAQASFGALASLKATGALNITAGTDLLIAGAEHGNGQTAKVSAASSGQASLKLDDSLLLSGHTLVALKATHKLSVEGNTAGGVGDSASVVAKAHATANLDETEGVNITTPGAFTAQAGAFMEFTGASGAGQQAKVKANGAGAKAAYVADGTLDVSALSIKLSASDMRVKGKSETAGGASVDASSAGSATLNADAGLNFTAVTAFSAKLTGSGAGKDLEIFSGNLTGANAKIDAANAASKAQLVASAAVDVAVTGATGTITISTGNRTGASLYLGGSTSAGLKTHAVGANGGSASATIDNGMVMVAKGAILLDAHRGQASLIAAYKKTGASESASVDTGGKSRVTTDSNLSITGGSVTVNAAGYIDVVAGRDHNAAGAKANASYGGSALAAVNTGLTIKAVTGALTMTAGSNLSIDAASSDAALSAAAHAGHGGAQANIALSAQLQLSGATAVALAAGKNLIVTANPAATSGSHDSVHASYGGKAGLSEDLDLSVVTPGALTAKAGKKLMIFGANGLGKHASVTAARGGAKATAQYDGTVTLSAKTESLAAGSSISVYGGGDGARQASVSADFGGAAKLDAESGVQIDAKSAVSMTLTGSGNAGKVIVLGGTGADQADASVGSHGGAADISIASGVGVAVTVTGGAISLSAGKHKGALISLGNASAQASHAQAAAKAGSASIAMAVSLDLQANGAVSVNAGASGEIAIGRGHSVALSATILGSGGHARIQAGAETDIGGASVTLTAGKSIALAGGGESAGKAARIDASHSGSAALDITTGARITATGAFTATAVGELVVTANSFGSSHVIDADMGSHVKLGASTGGGHASFKGTAGVDITAASVSLKAGGDLIVTGATGLGANASVAAKANSGDAVFTGKDDVEITATGALTLTAGQELTVSGGNSLARSAVIKTAHSGSNAAFSADGTVNFKAGTTFSTKAPSVTLRGGSSLGGAALISAAGRGAQATLTAEGGIGVTAGILSITATSSTLSINGARSVARGALAHASSTARAAITADGAVSLNAKGALTLAAAGSLDIGGGSGGFLTSLGKATAKGSEANATLDAENGIGLTAGGALTLKAGAKLAVQGGHAMVASAAASSSGVAQVKVGTGVALKAGTTLGLTAGGSLSIHGGNADGILLNTAYTPGATSKSSQVPLGTGVGKTSGQLNAAVTLNAGGDVNLKAAQGVTVAAGAGVTLAVGALRAFPTSGVHFHGSDWAGGSAQITAAVGATITAGHNLNVTAGAAGTGNLKVQGLRQTSTSSGVFINLETVRGGSNNAVAKLSLDADAVLSAANDLVLNVNGDASMAGGQLSFVAADHAKGNVKIAGSADATLHAGHDVVLNDVTGNLTVSGFKPGSTHSHAMSITALGHHGLTSVAAEADAAITAGHDIRTVTALGGNLDVIGGHGLRVMVPAGAGNPTGTNLATGTATAGLSAGSSILLSAKGGLTAQGGGADQVGAGTAATLTSGNVAIDAQAKLTATAGIKASKAVSLNVAGSASIGGGEGLQVDAGFTQAKTGSAVATGDASVLVSGGSLILTSGKSLVVFGGESNLVRATTSHDDSQQAVASGNAGATLSATGNITFNVGITTHGNAVFLGGQRASGEARTVDASSASATAIAHSDVLVKAGGAVSLTAGGNLTVAGGLHTQTLPLGVGTAAFASDNAASGALVAKTEVSADAGLSAGGNLTIVLKGGTADIAGGASIASKQKVATGGMGNNQAVLDAEAAATLHAGGALKLSGATAVTITAGAFAVGSNQTLLTNVSGPPSATLKSGVTISGNSVNLNGGVGVTTTSLGVLSNAGLVLDGSVHITSASGSPILSAPAPLSLGSLQTQGLVVNLVTLLGPAAADQSQGTVFSPALVGPAGFPASCATLLLKADAARRCTLGGR